MLMHMESRKVACLSRIEKSEWIDSVLDHPHQFHSPCTELFDKILFLPYPYPVFASTYIIKNEG